MTLINKNLKDFVLYYSFIAEFMYYHKIIYVESWLLHDIYWTKHDWFLCFCFIEIKKSLLIPL